MLKYIVIAIPEVQDSAYANGLFEKSWVQLKNILPPDTYIIRDSYPEKDIGAEEIRQEMRTYIKIGHSAVIMTKFNFALEQFCSDVDAGILEKDQVLFKLVRYTDNKPVVTEHYMTDDGCLGNNWPMGVLW